MIVAVIGGLALFGGLGFMAGRDTAGGPLDHPDVANFCTTAQQESGNWNYQCITRRRSEGEEAAALSGDCSAQRFYERVCLSR